VPTQPSLFDGLLRRRRVHLPQEARASGRRTSEPRAGSQRARVVMFLGQCGPATDHQIAENLNLPLASVNSLRNRLVTARVVKPIGLQPGPYGALRTSWGLVR
jgi:hypothetical protein